MIFFSKTKAAQKTDSVSKSGSSLDRFRRNFVHIDDTDSNSQPGRDNSDEDSFRHAYAGGEAEVNGAGDRENQTKSAHTSFSLNAFLAGLLRGRTRSGEASTEEKDQLRQRLLNENDSIINSSRNAATAAGVSTPSSSGTGASPDGANTNRGVGSTGRKNAGGDLNQSMESQATRYAVQGTPMQPAAVHGDHDAHFTTPRSRQYSGNRGRYPFAYQTLPVDECGGAENEPVGRSDSADREDIEQSFGFDVFSYRSSTTDGGQSMYTDAAASAIYSGGSGTGQLSGARSTAHNNVTDRNGHTSQYDSNRGAWSHTHRNQADARGVSFGGESSTQSVVIAKNVLQWSTPTGAGGQQHIVDMSDTESDV